MYIAPGNIYIYIYNTRCSCRPCAPRRAARGLARRAPSPACVCARASACGRAPLREREPSWPPRRTEACSDTRRLLVRIPGSRGNVSVGACDGSIQHKHFYSFSSSVSPTRHVGVCGGRSRCCRRGPARTGVRGPPAGPGTACLSP